MQIFSSILISVEVICVINVSHFVTFRNRVTNYQAEFPLAEAETSLNLIAISKVFHLIYKIQVMGTLFGIQKKLGMLSRQLERIEMERFKPLQNGWGVI